MNQVIYSKNKTTGFNPTYDMGYLTRSGTWNDKKHKLNVHFTGNIPGKTDGHQTAEETSTFVKEYSCDTAVKGTNT